MTTSLRIATQFLAEKDRVSCMREFYGRRLVGLDLQPLPEAGFDMDMSVLQFGGVSIGYGSLSPLAAERSKALAADGNHKFMLGTYAAPFLSTDARGNELVIAPGDGLAMSMDQPVRWLFPERSITTAVHMDPDALRSLLPGFEPREPMRLAAGAPGLDLFFSYARSIARAKDVSGLPDRLPERQMLELAAFALGGVRHPDEVGATASVRTARLQAVRADVRALFHQHDLSVRSLAARHGVSVRYLQILFEESGVTFTAYLQSVRLDYARARLAGAPAFMRIQDIAFEAGFSDLSTFNRLFRARFGDTPTALRQAAAAGALPAQIPQSG